MADDTHKQAIEWLRDWSKWVITLDFAAVTGCTIVLQIGVKGPPRPFLLLAIGAFSVSVVIAIAVVRALSTAIEDRSASGAKSVLELRLLRGVSMRAATRLQLAALTAGVALFLTWVALKPEPPTTNVVSSTKHEGSEHAVSHENFTYRLEAIDSALQEIRGNTSFTQVVRADTLDTVSSLEVEITGLRQETKLMLDVHQFAKVMDEFDSIEALLNKLGAKGDAHKNIDYRL